MNTDTVANVLLRTFKEYGGTHIFGVPGDYILPFANALEAFEGIAHIPLADEREAGWAANLVGRGQLSACYATSMVGCLNMLNPVCDATKNLGASAMVVIGGEVALADRGKNYILHHELGAPPSPDQLEVFQKLLGGEEYAQSITYLSSTKNDIKRLIARACEEHRPVYIGLPKDVCGMIAGGFVESRVHEVDESDMPYVLLLTEKIRNCIAAAKRPVILIGQGAERFGLIQSVKRLARAFDVPVAATCKGFGAYPTDDDYFVGTYSAQASYPPDIQSFIERSDCLISIGAVNCDMTNGLREPRLPQAAIIINPATCRVFVSGGWMPFFSIHGIQKMLENVPVGIGEDKRPPVRSFLSWMNNETTKYLHAGFCGNCRTRFTDIIPLIHDSLRSHPDTFVVADIGNAMTIPVVAAGGYYTSPYGAMAVTVGALGVELATGKRPFVIVGDGALGMWTLGSLLMLRKYRSKMIILVLNNAGFGMLRPITDNAPYLDLPYGHFDHFPSVLGGGLGFPVETPERLAYALKESFKANTFSIINVVVPKDDMTDMIRRLMTDG